ncbi:uncharacterized protein ALTATR162_LOCUS10572 [Alternaria atra]|uniref:Fe2OG dioxygenase domain-containing protein n=1 Tax=Alternaria atra TaxID=119953 RepID=A0A8J2N4C9_9PLEO|nr:uncharacterized protein ALTATR162_LOCUS10572 [Alternaria atra]CAG5183421.1 unnamed protein product [Alternaria atra]
MSSTTTTETETYVDTWVHYHDGGVPGRRPVLKGTAAKETFNELPKIDFQRIYSDNLDDRKELAREVGAACRDIGFFYAVNHGVDNDILEGTFEALKEYFALPKDIKMETHNQKTEKFRGYEAFLEGKLDPNLKEGFLMGEDFTDEEQLSLVSSLPPSPQTPRNQWPTHPSVCFWRPAIYRYYKAMFEFSKRMLHIFALALDLPEDYFDTITTHPMTNVRAVHYPPQERQSDVGIGAHTDFCWFTLVCQSKTAYPALEVLNGNGIWVPVHPQPNTFVVNIADFLKLVTGGSPNEDAKVSVVPHLREEGVRYDEFGVGEYFQKRLDIDRRTHLDRDEKEETEKKEDKRPTVERKDSGL